MRLLNEQQIETTNISSIETCEKTLSKLLSLISLLKNCLVGCFSNAYNVVSDLALMRLSKKNDKKEKLKLRICIFRKQLFSK